MFNKKTTQSQISWLFEWYSGYFWISLCMVLSSYHPTLVCINSFSFMRNAHQWKHDYTIYLWAVGRMRNTCIITHQVSLKWSIPDPLWCTIHGYLSFELSCCCCGIYISVLWLHLAQSALSCDVFWVFSESEQQFFSFQRSDWHAGSVRSLSLVQAEVAADHCCVSS